MKGTVSALKIIRLLAKRKLAPLHYPWSKPWRPHSKAFSTEIIGFIGQAISDSISFSVKSLVFLSHQVLLIWLCIFQVEKIKG